LLIRFDEEAKRWRILSTDRLVLPADGRDFPVVHMGNVWAFNKSPGQPFLNALGLEKVDFEGMFLRRAQPDTVPGSLSIFHFNAIRNSQWAKLSAFENYEEPNQDGFAFEMRGGRSDHYRNRNNHPIAFELRPDLIAISHAHEGKRMELALFPLPGNETIIYDFDRSFFNRKTALGFRDCLLSYGTRRAANETDWLEFTNALKPYIYTDIAPLVRAFFKTIAFEAGNMNTWQARGTALCQNALSRVEATYDTHLTEANERDINRINNQRAFLREVKKTRLHSGEVVDSRIEPSQASADSLFKLLGITRKVYIEELAAYMKDKKTSPYLVNLIQIALKDHDCDNIDEWQLTFDNPKLWTTLTHLRILAEIYGLTVYLYQLGNGIFVPLQVSDRRNRVIGSGPIDWHVAITNAHFSEPARCHVLLQFDRLIVAKDEGEQESLREHNATRCDVADCLFFDLPGGLDLQIHLSDTLAARAAASAGSF
jgi:hypothetical protein